MLSQVSIFAENKKGRLQNITSLLQKENINIWGSITNDSAEYGIIRMVVSNPEHAEKVLAEAEKFIRRDPLQWMMFFPVWPAMTTELDG